MEIKIGIRQSNREVVVESDLSADELAERVSAALAAEGVLSLEDAKTTGRRVLIPAEQLAYVETGAEHQARVGFGIA